MYHLITESFCPYSPVGDSSTSQFSDRFIFSLSCQESVLRGDLGTWCQSALDSQIFNGGQKPSA